MDNSDQRKGAFTLCSCAYLRFHFWLTPCEDLDPRYVLHSTNSALGSCPPLLLVSHRDPFLITPWFSQSPGKYEFKTWASSETLPLSSFLYDNLAFVLSRHLIPGPLHVSHCLIHFPFHSLRHLQSQGWLLIWLTSRWWEQWQGGRTVVVAGVVYLGKCESRRELRRHDCSWNREPRMISRWPVCDLPAKPACWRWCKDG